MAVYQQDSALKPLVSIQNEMSGSQDVKSAAKLDDLILKAMSGEKQVAFTGHFSAGKSTLINTLLQEEILPASPIPTSANLVYVRNGQNRILLDLHSGEQAEANPELELDELQRYCREGEEIARIHLWKPSEELPQSVALIDTPGVDSNDSSHMESTLSALHAADFIFYVTDYNHVQSAGTIEFVKRLIDDGQEAALIVNQIDKHQEQELSFSQFKERIAGSFAAIGLGESRIYYTTMKEPGHKHNELKRVKQTLQEQLADSKVRSETSQAELVITEHIRVLEDRENVSTEERRSLEERGNQLAAEIQRIKDSETDQKQKIAAAVRQAKSELAQVLSNANITPFEVREQAKRYIESKRPGFKAGLFFSKKKTEEAIKARQDEFIASLKELTASQIDWHLKELLLKTAGLLGVKEQSGTDISEFVTPHMETAAAKGLLPGADPTPEFVMNYSKQTADIIKNEAKKQALSILENIEIKAVERSSNPESAARMGSLLTEAAENDQKLLAILKLLEKKEYMLKVLHREIPAAADAKEWIQSRKNKDMARYSPLRSTVKGTDAVKNGREERAPLISKSIQTNKVLDRARALTAVTEGVKGLEERIRLIKEKSGRVEQRTFTIALFGAFSAGKSAAANALLGEKILPSSPNPTTAAINRIVPVTDEHVHGRVAIKRKTPLQLMEELKEIHPAGPFTDQPSFSSLLEDIRALLAGGALDSKRKDKLAVYEAGLQQEQWGDESVLWTDLTHFSPYVSDEKLAALVEEAVIYYDCPLTRRGVSLVDTPGADSLNKRHTKVAFQFIKQCDALLYVTYYNHPFSKGDREFVQQLGRVKDAFSLDKMFFLINAIDLAKNGQEAAEVKEYIESQLAFEGVRTPRMFGISSLYELAGKKLSVPSDFERFQNELSGFIEHDLVETAVTSLKDEMNGAVSQLQEYKKEADKSSDEKKAAFAQKQMELVDGVRYLESVSILPYSRRSGQEIKEQLYYLIQRLGLQFPDLFKAHFHPGIFNQEGAAKLILAEQMEELLQVLNHRLMQELQAITLRMEKKSGQLIGEMTEKLSAGLASIMNLSRLTSPEFKEMETPPLGNILEGNASAFKKEISLFTSTKAFFEKNERAAMSVAVWEKIHRELTDRLAETETGFANFYEIKLEEMANMVKEKFKKDAESHCRGFEDLYSDSSKPETMKEIHSRAVAIMEDL
ncbi:dynamin family protein [Metabacillus sp. 113a]|uniref:dynamin family protein n=1 Tax=Metabacillus sp. 113a TaxID=3404706 RepID=UPI003CF74B74